MVIGMHHDSNEVAKEDKTLALDNPAELLPLVLDDELDGLWSEHRHIFHVAQGHVEVQGVAWSNM